MQVHSYRASTLVFTTVILRQALMIQPIHCSITIINPTGCLIPLLYDWSNSHYFFMLLGCCVCCKMMHCRSTLQVVYNCNIYTHIPACIYTCRTASFKCQPFQLWCQKPYWDNLLSTPAKFIDRLGGFSITLLSWSCAENRAHPREYILVLRCSKKEQTAIVISTISWRVSCQNHISMAL